MRRRQTAANKTSRYWDGGGAAHGCLAAVTRGAAAPAMAGRAAGACLLSGPDGI